MIRCPYCGHKYRWRPGRPCRHALFVRWVIADIEKRQLITKRRWTRPVAIEHAGQLDAIASQVLQCGRVRGQALPAGIMIEHDGAEHHWHPDWLLEVVGMFGDAEWSRNFLTLTRAES